MPVTVKKSPFWAPPFDVYRASSPRPGRVLLESARTGGTTGRYSLFAQNPFLIFEHAAGRTRLRSGGRVKSTTEHPLLLLKKIFAEHRIPDTPDLPPFSGGAVGYFGYEAKNMFEPSLGKHAGKNGTGVPDIYLLFFHEGVVFDHARKETVFFSDKGPEAPARMEKDLRRRLEAWSPPKKRAPGAMPDPKSIRLSMERSVFCQKVRAAQRYIAQGDIYQANLSHSLSFGVRKSAEQIYEELRRINPSPFFGLLDAGRFQILSGSPERLIRLEGRRLDTRPIAGTRPRKKGASDAAATLELVLNEKERAEHLMLLDLERNDLGRVAEYGSVVVDELMTVEDYSHVKHIVSNVRATLREGLGAMDVLKAFFPGGTITGAPKIRCMQIIEELEAAPRGPYTGSLGYISFTGNMDFNIIIRSLVLQRGRARLNVGAGIVADSDADKEFDETLYKAEAVLRAVFGEEGARRFLGSCGTRSRMPG